MQNPYFYSNNPVISEVLAKLASDVLELQEKFATWEELQKRLEKYVKDFDETLKAEIIAEIQALFDAGTFDDVIASLVSIEIDDRPKCTDSLNMQRIFQRLMGKTSYGGFTTMQGNVAFKTSKNDRYTHYVGCFASGDTTNEIRIQEWKFSDNPELDNDFVPTTVRTTAGQELHLGHANGIAYDPNENVYLVAHYFEYMSGVKTGVSYVSVVKPTSNSFELDRTNTTPHRYLSITYSHTDDCFYAHGEDNKIYKYDYKTNTDDYICTPSIELTIPVGATSAGYISSYSAISHNDGYFYFQNHDNAKSIYHQLPSKQILVFDKTGKLYWTYKIEKSYNGYELGEIEQISFDKFGNSFVGTTQHVYTKDYNPLRQNQFFKVDFYTNITYGLNIDALQYGNAIAHVYVRNEKQSANMYEYGNPKGTIENPFFSHQEAINYINNNPKISAAELRIENVQWGSSYPMIFYGSKPITVRWGTSNYQDTWTASENGNDSIGNVAIYGSANIAIRFANIKSRVDCESTYVDSKGVTQWTNPGWQTGSQITAKITSIVQIKNSTAELQSCTFTDSESGLYAADFNIFCQNGLCLTDTTEKVNASGVGKILS